jgi:DNA polymerase-3 subunit gamma/tau
MVFYRKYRPQVIDDLDSTAVRDTLHAVLKRNTPHAFLFTGPKGLGKTSTARIVAKVVNCTAGIVGEPCNACDQCVSITNGTSLDVLEIDAASNRGIDEMRDLKEKIRLAPVSAKKKVYIIDEVHMLTTEAFNALLKTLEEPPVHAMFLLCTTEPQKIPPTILSRCFHLSFHLATSDELVRSFKRIVAGENVSIDDEALRMIADLSEGGFRDGSKILEEIISLAGDNKITTDLIEKTYHVSGIQSQVSKLLESLQQKEIQAGFLIIRELVDQGTDMKSFIQKMIERVHVMFLEQVGVMGGKNDKEPQFSLEEMQSLFFLLTQASSEIKYAVLPQLPLELAIVSWCTAQELVQETVAQSSPVTSLVLDDGVSVSTLRKQISTKKKMEALYGAPPKQKEQVIEKPLITSTVALEHTKGDGTVTKEWLDHFWDNLILEMKKHNHTVAGVLRGCKIRKYADNQLIIETAYAFHKERLDELKNREALLSVAKLLTGKEIEIAVELKR